MVAPSLVMVTSPMSSTNILSSPTGPREDLTMLATEEAASTFCVLTSPPVFLSPWMVSAGATVVMVNNCSKIDFGKEKSGVFVVCFFNLFSLLIILRHGLPKVFLFPSGLPGDTPGRHEKQILTRIVLPKELNVTKVGV